MLLQGVFGVDGTSGLQLGAAPFQSTSVGAFESLSSKEIVPPWAIVKGATSLNPTFASGLPLGFQHGQLGVLQFWATSSFASDGAAASAGSTTTAAPASPARAT